MWSLCFSYPSPLPLKLGLKRKLDFTWLKSTESVYHGTRMWLLTVAVTSLAGKLFGRLCGIILRHLCPYLFRYIMFYMLLMETS